MKTLSLNEVAETAPAIFTTSKSHKVTDRYSFVPTIEILDKFLSEGWQITHATQRGKDLHGKHFVRMKLDKLPQVGDCLPELLLSNSHDGSTPFNLSTGLHRLVCSNGLTVPTGLSHVFKLRHVNFSVEQVREITDDFASKLPFISDKVRRMSEKALSWTEQCSYVEAAKILRWGKEKAPILNHQEILVPRRNEDADPTLWNTFNLVQEKFVGGTKELVNSGGRERKVTALKNFQRVNTLNTALWELAENML
jgi:hypothetical protein